jgi:hypothetical protein
MLLPLFEIPDLGISGYASCVHCIRLCLLYGMTDFTHTNCSVALSYLVLLRIKSTETDSRDGRRVSLGLEIRPL